MNVLHPAFLLIVIAGQAFVNADEDTTQTSSDALESTSVLNDTPASTSATFDAVITEKPTDNIVSDKMQAPESLQEEPVEEPLVPKSNDNAIPAENSNGYAQRNLVVTNENSNTAERNILLAILDQIVKALDDEVPPVKGTSAVPLLSGKNYDFFLLKVLKRSKEKTTKKTTLKDFARSSNTMGFSKNILRHLLQIKPSQTLASGQCPCARPPSQVAPHLKALQSIYGSVLDLNSLLNPVCPPGLVPVMVPNMPFATTFGVLPEIDGILDNGLGNPNLIDLEQNLNPYFVADYHHTYPYSTSDDQLGPYPPSINFNEPLAFPQNGDHVGISPRNPMHLVEPLDQSGLSNAFQPPINPYDTPQNGDPNNPQQQYGGMQQQLYHGDFPGSYGE